MTVTRCRHRAVRAVATSAYGAGSVSSAPLAYGIADALHTTLTRTNAPANPCLAARHP